MKLPVFARIPFVVCVAMLLAAGCALSPGGSPTPPPTAVSSQSPPATAPPATPTIQPPPTPTQAHATPTAEPTETEGTPPPIGSLTSGTETVAGSPGSYCYLDTCADLPAWPPKADLPEIAGSRDGELSFALGDTIRFVEWRASYAATSNGETTELGGGPSGFDPDAVPTTPWPELSSVSFSSPPSGNWVLYVRVGFTEGDASYAWHVVVP